MGVLQDTTLTPSQSSALPVLTSAPVAGTNVYVILGIKDLPLMTIPCLATSVAGVILRKMMVRAQFALYQVLITVAAQMSFANVSMKQRYQT
jgi:hypothetical protein